MGEAGQREGKEGEQLGEGRGDFVFLQPPPLELQIPTPINI